MGKPRILFSIVNGHIAGGQRVCMDCINIARDMGIIPILLSQTDGEFVEKMRKQDIKVFIEPMKRISHFYRLPALLNVLKKEKPNLIHTHDTLPGNVLMRIAARILNIPLMSHIHVKNKFSRSKLKTWVAKVLDNLTSRTCIKIIAVSNHTKGELICQGYAKSMITVIRNSIHLDEFNEVKKNRDIYNKEFDIPQGAVILLHIGRLCEDKGQIDLIKAIKPIIDENKNTYCLLAGKDVYEGGKFRERLINMIDSCALNKNIRLLGFRDDVDSLLDYCDIFILPSYFEGMPVSILEAMKHRKPVIAYKTSGVQEQVDNGVNGYLIDKGDIKALEIKIRTLISNSGLRRCMGEAGYKILQERFNYDSYRNNIRNLYKEIFSEVGNEKNSY